MKNVWDIYVRGNTLLDGLCLFKEWRRNVPFIQSSTKCSAALQTSGVEAIDYINFPLHWSLRCCLIGVLILTAWGITSLSKKYRQNSTLCRKDNLKWQSELSNLKIRSWAQIEYRLDPDQPRDRNSMFLFYPNMDLNFHRLSKLYICGNSLMCGLDLITD